MPLCPRCGEENAPVARFCQACGAPLTPVESRQERKVLTVLFADLVGFTSRSDGSDPEDVKALLSDYHRRARHELERHGGTVEKFIGDAVVALFGAPTTHEDDPERAVRAALAILTAIDDLNGEEPERDLRVRIGITTGEALVSLDARLREGEGMASGDVVNTAARLQAAARENGILVDESTQRATAAAIDSRPVEPVTAKGKTDPIAAWEVVGARSSFGVDVVQGAPTRLVGRRQELDALTQALARARSEQTTQLVTLVGVPGIGKSRLIWELFKLVDDDPELITWRQGRCLPYGEGIAYWALGEMVKAQLGLLETDSADEAAAKLQAAVADAVPEDEHAWVLANLGPLVGLPGEERSNTTESFAAWRRFLEGLAEQGPLVLIFEDLHWADDGLLDFVDHLVDWASGVPLLVVCSARPELLERRPTWGGGKLNATTLGITPLSGEDAARLVAALLDQPLLPAELQQVLLERAEGNPLYAEQYVRMLTDRGLLVRRDGGWELAGDEELPLPETLQGIIAARIDGLPAEEKRLLQDAAVVGKVFWLGAVEDPSPERLHLLERKGFVLRERRASVAGEAEFAFTHALVRDVAYGQIPRLERAQKHRRVAEWIEQLTAERAEDHAQLAAHHWLAALELSRAARRDDPELAARASEALVEAGARAYRLGAIDPARDLYAQALSLQPADDPGRSALLLAYGAAAARSGVDAEAELIEAAESFLADHDVERAADAMGARTWFLWQAGDTETSMRVLEEGLKLVADRPPSAIQGWVFSEYAIYRTLGGRLELGREYAQRQLAIAEELGIDRLKADALITLGTNAAIAGDYKGLAQIEVGLELARELNDVQGIIRAHKNLQSLSAQYGELERAAAYIADGRRTALHYGDEFHAGWFQVESAVLGFVAGDWTAALDEIHLFLDGLGERKHYMIGPAQMTLGRILAERGDVAEGIASSGTSLGFARSVQEQQQLLPALASHACVLMRAGRADEAQTLVDEYLQVYSEPSYSVADLALVLNLLGRDADFAKLRLNDTSPWAEAATEFANGGFAAAADRYAAFGARLHEAESRLRLAERLAAAGRRGEADRERAAAAAFFERAGSPERASGELRAVSGP
jgi:class 3 adenylate cyclase